MQVPESNKPGRQARPASVSEGEKTWVTRLAVRLCVPGIVLILVGWLTYDIRIDGGPLSRWSRIIGVTLLTLGLAVAVMRRRMERADRTRSGPPPSK